MNSFGSGDSVVTSTLDYRSFNHDQPRSGFLGKKTNQVNLGSEVHPTLIWYSEKPEEVKEIGVILFISPVPGTDKAGPWTKSTVRLPVITSFDFCFFSLLSCRVLSWWCEWVMVFSRQRVTWV